MTDEKQKSIGALWAKTSAKGEYYTGNVELENGDKLKIVVFRNSFKNADNQPDWKIYLSKPREEKAAWPTREDLDANGPSEQKSSDDPFSLNEIPPVCVV